jgi:hypothetical protein
LNGVLDATAASYTYTMGQTASRISGFNNTGTYNFTGYISNLRVTKNAQYGTNNFTVPTTHLTLVTNVAFLLQTRGVINPDPPEANSFLTNLTFEDYSMT